MLGAEEDIGILGGGENINSNPHSSRAIIGTQLKERKDKLIYRCQSIQHLIYTIYIPVVLKERIHKCVPTDKNIHIIL